MLEILISGGILSHISRALYLLISTSKNDSRLTAVLIDIK